MYENYEGRFTARLEKLRKEKGVSAKDMSLAIGQNEGYISQIERGTALPSLSGFFYICEYFGVPPKYFLDDEVEYPADVAEIVNHLKGFNKEQLSLAKGVITAIAKSGE